MGYGMDEDWDSGVGFGTCVQIDNANGELTWTMRNGTSMRIVDMTNGHLRNTLRMLQRNGANPPQLSALLDEARSRGLKWWR